MKRGRGGSLGSGKIQGKRAKSKSKLEDFDDDESLASSLSMPVHDSFDMSSSFDHDMLSFLPHEHDDKGKKKKKKPGSSVGAQLPLSNHPACHLPLPPLQLTLCNTPALMRLANPLPKQHVQALHAATKVINGQAIEELKQMAMELLSAQKEAKSRALSVDVELHKLYELHSSLPRPTSSHLPPLPPPRLDEQEWYQVGLAALQHDTQNEEELARELGMDTKKKKHSTMVFKKSDDGSVMVKRAEEGDDSEFSPLKQKPMMKKKGAKKADDDASGASDEEWSDSGGPKTKKKKPLTEKEKQRQLGLFWEDVNAYFSFPDASISNAIKPMNNFSGPLFSIPAAGVNYKDIERQREEDARQHAERVAQDKALAEKYQQELAAGASAERLEELKKKKKSKKKPKKSLTTNLQEMGLEDMKLRKSVMDTDKALGGEKNFFAQTLSQRLLSILIDDPNNSAAATWSMPTNAATNTKAEKEKNDTENGKSESAAKKKTTYTIDERIKMELKSIGVLDDINFQKDLLTRADDEVCAELRSVQAQLKAHLTTSNTVKERLYPVSVRLHDHTHRLNQLLEAEQNLIRAYRKKKTNEQVMRSAVDSIEHTYATIGTRRAISGFVPDPVDLGGIPRYLLHTYHPARKYFDVFANGPDPPQLPPGTEPNYKHIVPPHHMHNPDYEPEEVKEEEQYDDDKFDHKHTQHDNNHAASDSHSSYDFHNQAYPPAQPYHSSAPATASYNNNNNSNFNYQQSQQPHQYPPQNYKSGASNAHPSSNTSRNISAHSAQHPYNNNYPTQSSSQQYNRSNSQNYSQAPAPPAHTAPNFNNHDMYNSSNQYAPSSAFSSSFPSSGPSIGLLPQSFGNNMGDFDPMSTSYSPPASPYDSNTRQPNSPTNLMNFVSYSSEPSDLNIGHLPAMNADNDFFI